MELYDFQKELARVIRSGRNVLLQAPTGAGKTLAALVPFLQAWSQATERVPRHCIYSVPMRVLANQFTHEYERFVKETLQKVATVPRVHIQTGEQPNDPEFEADLTFATIDQVLSSWLLQPYSLSRRKGNLNAGALVGSYLVFDEFHLFDPDSTLPTTLDMLKTLRGISPFVLMTATFSAQMLQELAGLLDAEPLLLTADDLENIDAQQKVRRFHVRQEPLVAGGIVQPDFILQRHAEQDGDYRRSVVILNQVERAQQVYEALCAQAEQGTEIRLLHSRFRAADRKRIEDEVRRAFGKEKAHYRRQSMILVATQVIEVGLDITCAALHTELAPAASVLQRAGRCARYQDEVGDVYVYAVDGYGPYFGEAEAQCVRAMAWLSQNQERHLTFDDEQALVNHAHGPSDRHILAQLDAGSYKHRESIRALWRGEGGRAEAQKLIRNIQSQSILIHSNPDALLHRPFATETFSLHPGTIQGKFERWQEEAQEDFMRDALPWAVCRLVEVEADAEANRPITYEWKKVHHKSELWGTPLLVARPELVGYRDDIGLMLYDGSDYESPVPQMDSGTRRRFFYRLETYEEHVRLVYEAFAQNSDRFRPAAQRLERNEDWRPGVVMDMAQLVVLTHDLGKLGEGWQRWALQWQDAIGWPHREESALAHTDYDGTIEEHRQLERRLRGKRPPHAVESALAAVPFLLRLVEGKLNHPLFRAGFTAIARHHAPQSRNSDGYALVMSCESEVKKTFTLLPRHLEELGWAVLESGHFAPALGVEQLPEDDFIRTRLLIDERNPADVCAYALLVRALRHADQKGTERGATRLEVS
ncbi:MAG: CRISPR-associated helicase Cas3' [Chloroflexota bacterium]